ncbi:hypothetical protein Q8G35_21695 [Peribacillus simplex]|uniref:Uncharacterized protein n=2 Tax=Peribacillus TaxID=2675229 RepID=A0AA90T7M9_9BACI|nr:MULTISPECIES: hypothetical protein [Peribacillus]MDP1420920.1 hypothetical protein [Peribacillus simplex]MDP1452862.1 hypothetical protein [Peribacillus frigoritolerans]
MDRRKKNKRDTFKIQHEYRKKIRKEKNNKETNLEMMIVAIILFILIIATWIFSLS